MATDKAMDDVKNQVTDHGFPVGRVYGGLAPAKSTNRQLIRAGSTEIAIIRNP